MNKLKKTFSLRKKKDLSEDESNEDDWQEDELRVRQGRCSFLLEYLGCIEVNDSKGIHICEEALKQLIDKCQGKYTTVIFQVTGDQLRAIDETTSDLVLDQPVEKVAFCSPDRNNDRGFAYICRDSVAKKWICHGFLTLKDQGERVSYAVGYAFNVCMELRIAKEQLTEPSQELKKSSSYKFASITDRRCDPQSVKAAEPIPMKRIENFQSTKRPRAPPELLKRQSSLVGLNDQSHEGTFKRQLSLKVEELSTILNQLNTSSPKRKHPLNTNMDNLFDNELNNNHGNENKGIEPVRQSNPWTNQSPREVCKSAPPANAGVDADDWLRSVTKKAVQLGKQSEVRKVVTQTRTQSVDFAAISAKIERQKGLKGSVNVYSSDWKNSVERSLGSLDDPFDIGWAQGLAIKGSNPFKVTAPMKT